MSNNNGDNNIEAIYRLSPVQEGILFHSLYAPGSGVYFQQYTCVLHGTLDDAAFAAAWRKVVHRHPVLRTLFTWERRDHPLQIVRRRVELPFEVLDWTAFDDRSQSDRLGGLIAQERRRGFRLEHAPLLRIVLVKLAAGRHRVLCNFHHLILDGWSFRLVLGEFFEHYRAQVTDTLAPALPPPRPYQEYIALTQAHDAQSSIDYWRERLAGLESPTRLPGSALARAGRGFTGAEGRGTDGVMLIDDDYAQQDRVLDAATSLALRDMARDHRLTLNSVIQGAWAILLAKYCGELDVVFGATTSTRPQSVEGAHRMVGLMINSLPVRATLSPEQPLALWLQDLQRTELASREHASCPLVHIHGASEYRHAEPLFDSLVVFENYPREESLTRGLALRIDCERHVERSNYALALLVVPGDSMAFSLVYDRRRYLDPEMQRVLLHLERLLQSMAAAPAQSLSQLSLLSDDERQRLSARSAAASGNGITGTVVAQISAQAARTPEALALSDGERSVSYADLEQRACAAAAWLSHNGVCAGDRVVLCMPRAPELIVAMLAVLKAGAAYVPVDPDNPQERLRAVVEDAGAAVVLTDSADESLGASLGGCARVLAMTQVPQLRADAVQAMVQGSQLAYLIYTSGSTGTPKGVEITHASLMYSTAARVDYYRGGPGVFALMSSIASDSSVAGIYWTLVSGGCLLLPARRAEQNVSELARLMARSGVTHTLLLPSLYSLLLEHAAADDLGSLETVIVAGEACSAQVAARHHASQLDARLFNEYGPTEATVWCTVHPVAPLADDAIVPIGRPIPGTRALVVDRFGQPVPDGVAGELLVCGPGLARGYRNRPEQTAARFVSMPDFGERRLYRTGDLARLNAAGEIEFLGRIDHQVKVRGFRVELEEVAAVIESHRDVHQSVVATRSEVSRGGADDEQRELQALLESTDAETVAALLADVESIPDAAVEALLAMPGGERTGDTRGTRP